MTLATEIVVFAASLRMILRDARAAAAEAREDRAHGARGSGARGRARGAAAWRTRRWRCWSPAACVGYPARCSACGAVGPRTFDPAAPLVLAERRAQLSSRRRSASRANCRRRRSARSHRFARAAAQRRPALRVGEQAASSAPAGRARRRAATSTPRGRRRAGRGSRRRGVASTGVPHAIASSTAHGTRPPWVGRHSRSACCCRSSSSGSEGPAGGRARPGAWLDLGGRDEVELDALAELLAERREQVVAALLGEAAADEQHARALARPARRRAVALQVEAGWCSITRAPGAERSTRARAQRGPSERQRGVGQRPALERGARRDRDLAVACCGIAPCRHRPPVAHGRVHRQHDRQRCALSRASSARSSGCGRARCPPATRAARVHGCTSRAQRLDEMPAQRAEVQTRVRQQLDRPRGRSARARSPELGPSAAKRASISVRDGSPMSAAPRRAAPARGCGSRGFPRSGTERASPGAKATGARGPARARTRPPSRRYPGLQASRDPP